MRDIKGLEGLYAVTREGNVWSYPKFGRHSGKIMIPAKDKKGYLQVRCNRKTTKVHRAVATAYIENPENKPCVGHLNNNPADNRVENLVWCTYSENERHKYNTGYYRKLTKKDMEFIIINMKNKTKSAKELQKKFNVCLSNIYMTYYKSDLYKKKGGVKMQKCKCSKCGHEWIPRVENPVQCSRCKRYDWKGVAKDVKANSTRA